MNHEKLEILLLNETGLIKKYLMKIGVSKEDAEDIVQDTVVKAMEYVDSLQEGNISAWLFKVSINRYYNLYNKKKNRNLELDEQTIANLSSDETVEANVLDAEFRDRVRKVLSLLKESYKNLIILKYFMDLSYREISEMLGLDENQVKTYLYRARNKFKEIWRELEDGR